MKQLLRLLLMAVLLVAVGVSAGPNPVPRRAEAATSGIQWLRYPGLWNQVPFDNVPVDSSGRPWYDPAYDDSAWVPVGLPDVDTIIPNSDAFYRVRFPVVAPSDASPVSFQSDDGMSLYVNGNFAGGWGGWRTEGCVNRCFLNRVNVSPQDVSSSLVAGANTIAVRVSNAQSFFISASYFDLTLPAPTSTSSALGPASSNLTGAFSTTDPVNLATGNYVYEHVDAFVSGKGVPLDHVRYYNSMGPLSASVAGNRWSFTYGTRVITATDYVDVVQATGRTDRYTLDGSGSYQPPLGVFDTLANDADGTFTITRKDRTVLQFDSAGNLTSISDRNGNATTLDYTSGRLTTVTDASGRTLTYSYDADRIGSIADPLGRVTTYVYESDGALASVVRPDRQALGPPENGAQCGGGTGNGSDDDGDQAADDGCPSTIYTYDAGQRMTSIRDARDHVILTNQYDAQGRVSAQTNAAGDTWSFAYGAGQTTETNPRGCATTHLFDLVFREVRRVDCLSGETTYTYDGYGSRNSVTDVLGRATNLTFDARGNMLTLADAAGETTVYTYSAQDGLLSKTDPLGRTTTFTYDVNGNLLTSTDSIGGVTTFTYDPGGLLLTSTDPRGKTSNFTYNSNGYQATATDPLGNTTTSVYDAGGRLLSQTDPLGHTTTFTFDDVDRLLSFTDPLSHSTSFVYDDDGNKTLVTDANGVSTAYAYDALNRLVLVTDGEGGVVMYGYDALGNRTSMTDANGHVTTYAYDSLNRLLSVADPEGNVTSHTYDAVGNRKTRTDANGVTTNYSYDVLNRLVTIDYPDQVDVTYTYDVLGNRVTMKDVAGTTTYIYDALYRLTHVSFPGGREVSYTYDAAGNRTSLTYPDASEVSYTYDDASRLETVAGVTYTYDEASNQIGATLPNGVETTRTYDNANRLTGISHSKSGNNMFSLSYALDPVANRLSRTETAQANPPQADIYSYDDLYRLTGVDYASNPDQVYTFDAMGNRTSLTEGGSLTAYSYDAADRILSAGTTTFTFDANGNQVRKGNRSYRYDHENRLLQVAEWTGTPGNLCADANWDGIVNSADLDAIAASFNVRTGMAGYQPVLDLNFDGAINSGDIGLAAEHAGDACQVLDVNLYNGDGLRIYRSEASSTQFFTWDVRSGVPVILTDGADNWVYGLELLRQGTGTWYLQDGLGSTVATTDGSGAALGTYDYDVYGTPRTAAPQFGFTGQQHDSDGSVYLRARSYEPGLGRFGSEDEQPGSIGITSSLNRYAYAFDSPVNLLDEEGEWPHFVVAGVVGGVFGGGSYLVKQWITGQPPKLGDFVGSATSGAVMASLMSVGVAPTIAGAAGGAAGSILQHAIDDRRLPTPSEYVGDAAAGGALSFLGTKALGKVPGAKPSKLWTGFTGAHGLRQFQKAVFGLNVRLILSAPSLRVGSVYAACGVRYCK